MTLDTAPDDIKLAVDLIQLLEENRCPRPRCWLRWRLSSAIMSRSWRPNAPLSACRRASGSGAAYL